MRLIEILKLMEAREDFIAQQMGSKLIAAYKRDIGEDIKPEDAIRVVNELKQADPQNGKNLQFIARMYVDNQFKLEDVERLKMHIADFMKYRSRLPIKDLNQVKSLKDLYDLIDPFKEQEKEELPVQGQRQEFPKDTEIIMDTPRFTVVVPKTEDASKELGRGTIWCTAYTTADNKFETYNAKGPLYIIITRFGGKKRKFQVAPDSDQFMDEQDIPVSAEDIKQLSQIPEYTKFLNFLIKKYYGQYIK